jgi:hypothetical protein
VSQTLFTKVKLSSIKVKLVSQTLCTKVKLSSIKVKLMSHTSFTQVKLSHIKVKLSSIKVKLSSKPSPPILWSLDKNVEPTQSAKRSLYKLLNPAIKLTIKSSDNG